MIKFPTAVLFVFSIFGLARCEPEPLEGDKVRALYATPLSPTDKPLSVFHIGHSLVSRDLPSMLAQLAPKGHRYEFQLGWGASLRHHWEPDMPLNGAEFENAHPRFREAHAAISSGEYDVLVLTEAVEIRDSIKYHTSWDYLARWTKAARFANPSVRIYVYETWHETNDPEGWFQRIDNDLQMYWEHEIIDRALSVQNIGGPIYVIPAGQVMAQFLREVKKRGGVDGITNIDDLFIDNIHVNDLGMYLVALTHYAVIYGRSPVGQSRALTLNTGEAAELPSEEAAELMQQVVWKVVASYSRTGVTSSAAPNKSN